MAAEEKEKQPTGRLKPVFTILAGAAILVTAAVLFIWPFNLTAREKTAEQWIQEGLTAFKRQDYFQATRAFEAAIRLDPQDGHAPYYLGQVYDSCGRRKEASAWYAKALQNEPALAAASFNLGLLYGIQRAPEMELNLQQQAVVNNPLFAAAWLRVGELYYQREEWKKAVEAYTAAGRNPNAVVDRTLIKTRLSAAMDYLTLDWLPQTTEKLTLPDSSPGSDRLCVRCHNNPPAVHSLERDNTFDCLRCHAPHNPLYPPRLRIPEKNECQICHFEYSSSALKAARKEGALVHIPLINGNCRDCHLEHALGEKSALRINQRVLCFTCHPDYKNELTRPVKHPPYGNSFCTDCHNPHLSKHRGLLWGPQNQMCYNCHFAFKNITLLPVQHSPFEKGFCTSCHEPHASNYRGLLRTDQLRLCYSCHFDRDADLSKPVKHKPYAEGKCVDCHDPHATRTKGLLPAPSQTEFCLLCHSRAYVFGPKHHPAPEGLACTDCHSPHAGYLKALLPKKSPDLCFDCHTFGQGKMALTYYKRSKHGKLSCFECHGKEGFGFGFKTPEERLRVCLSCHPGYTERTRQKGSSKCYLHPVGPPWVDVNTNKLLTCSSTCHNPHGTAYRKLLTGGDGLCLQCHKDKKRRI
jgi:predicted CXXCH cytochrome family protein